MPSRLLLIALLISMPRAGMPAQSIPDFSGTWTFDADHSSKTQILSGGSSAGPTQTTAPFTPTSGQEISIRQDAKALTLTRTIVPATPTITMNGVERPSVKGDPVTFTVAYPLNGSEVKFDVPSSSLGRPATGRVATASWDAATIVIVQWQGATPASKLRLTISKDSDGRLIVQATLPAMGIVAPQTLTSVYTKKPTP